MGNKNRCGPKKNSTWQMQKRGGERTCLAGWLRSCKQLLVCRRLRLRKCLRRKERCAPWVPPPPAKEEETEAREKVGSETSSVSFTLRFLSLADTETPPTPPHKVFSLDFPIQRVEVIRKHCQIFLGVWRSQGSPLSD